MAMSPLLAKLLAGGACMCAGSAVTLATVKAIPIPKPKPALERVAPKPKPKPQTVKMIPQVSSKPECLPQLQQFGLQYPPVDLYPIDETIVPPTGGGGEGPYPAPEPASLVLFGAGLVGLVKLRSKG